MKIIDLSQRINRNMPVYPGTESPKIEAMTTIDQEGFVEKWLTLSSHTGTHVDSPSHLIKNAKSLDDFELSTFVGQGLVIPVATGKALIEIECIESSLSGKSGIEYILLHTQWDKKWGQEDYFKNFPVLTHKAATYVARRGIKGVGIDCISVDPLGDTGMVNHNILLNSDLVIIENLCNLEPLMNRPFLFCCFPLKIDQADGSPIRAAGIVA